MARWFMVLVVVGLALGVSGARAQEAGGILAPADRGDGWPVAVVAHELASQSDVPANRQGRLLHGLFVLPPHQQQGLGRLLTQRVIDVAARDGLDGVAVRAWRDAVPFFSKLGFTPPHDTHDADGAQHLRRPLP